MLFLLLLVQVRTDTLCLFLFLHPSSNNISKQRPCNTPFSFVLPVTSFPHYHHSHLSVHPCFLVCGLSLNLAIRPPSSPSSSLSSLPLLPPSPLPNRLDENIIMHMITQLPLHLPLRQNDFFTASLQNTDDASEAQAGCGEGGRRVCVWSE